MIVLTDKQQPTITPPQDNPQLSMLKEDKYSHLEQLRTLTATIQENQQLLSRMIVREISDERVGWLLDKVSAKCVDLIPVMLEWLNVKRQFEQVEEIIKEVQIGIEEKRTIRRSYFGKVEEKIMKDCPIIRKMLRFAEGCSLGLVAREYLSKYIEQLVRDGSGSYESARHLSQLLQFLRQYQSDAIYQRFLKMVSEMQDSICGYLSTVLRLGEEYMQEETTYLSQRNCEQELEISSRRKMEIRIDLQIVENRMLELEKDLGIQNRGGKLMMHYVKNQEQSISSRYVLQVLVNFVADIIEDQLSNSQSVGSSLSSSKCEGSSLIQSFNEALLIYLQLLEQQYLSQYRGMEGSRTTFKILLISTIREVFSSHARISLQNRSNKERMIKIQQNLNEIEEELMLTSRRTLKRTQNINWQQNRQFQQLTSEIASMQNSQVIALPVTSNTRNHQKRDSRRDLSVSIRFSRKTMDFRVMKTMHIGDANHLSSRKKYGERDESCKERILAFGKKKLILKKQNPHFHEEIQLKRILRIKITSHSNALVYFRKGYMSLDFIDNSSREWVRCFKAVYYAEESLSTIQFVNSGDFTDRSGGTSSRTDKYSRKASGRGRNSYREKENDSKNTTATITQCPSKITINGQRRIEYA